jgi:hypothetical protein
MTTLDDNFKNPEILKEKLQILKQKLPAILDDFKKYYIFFNKNPEYPEYQNHFENIKGNLRKIHSELFILSNEEDSSTQDINKRLFEMNLLIQKEKERNRMLKKKLGIIENKNNASTELISDYKQIYNSEYLRNWALFFSILIIGAYISKMNSKIVK